MMGRQKKRGFTLMETVVTVGIVASLAAVVYPQVVKQFDAADPTRIQNDLKNIQTAIETFNVNVKALPGDLEDLVVLITAADDSTITTATTLLAHETSAPALWKGPYLDQSLVENADTDDDLTTGFGAKIVDSFVCYAAGNNQRGISDASGTAAANDQACPGTATGQYFLAIQLTGVSCSTTAGSTFLAINELFDGSGEASADVNGRVRCLASGAANKTTDVDVVYFLAVPIT